MFNSKVAFVFCLTIVFSVAQHEDHAAHMNHEANRVKVVVYYESLCPDSKKFFTQQLYPSLNEGNLSKYVNLTLIPYGKTTKQFKTSDYEFVCHHGPAECTGNKIQACALKLIDNGNKTEGLGFNRVAAGFINCLMDKTVRNGENATFPTKDCAELNHVINLNSIENCAAHTDGSNFLANLGALTESFQNPLESVPVIVFEGEYKAKDNSLAQTNFVKALCQYIQGEKPHECSGANNINISLGLMLVTAFVTKIFY